MGAHALPGRIGVRAVLALSWPICVSMLSYTAMTVADSIFVGRLGTAPLAALGLAASAIHAGTAFGHGLIGGMRVHVARSTGANQPAEAGAYGWQGLWIALGMGAAVALAAPAGPWIFACMGGSDEVSALASRYYAIRTGAAPAVFLFVALSAWFCWWRRRCRCSTRWPPWPCVTRPVLRSHPVVVGLLSLLRAKAPL